MSHHNDSEGKLHAARRPLISNQKLMECSLALGLPSFVIGKPFVIRFWAPANFRMNPPGGSVEKGKEKETTESVKKFRGVPENVRLFEVFWQQVVELIKACL